MGHYNPSHAQEACQLGLDVHIQAASLQQTSVELPENIKKHIGSSYTKQLSVKLIVNNYLCLFQGTNN